MAQKASEMKWENFRVVMLSLTMKPLHRGIIKQRGTQAACGCVLNSERFCYSQGRPETSFSCLTVGQRAREDPRYPVCPLCQGARLWGSLSEPYGIHIHNAVQLPVVSDGQFLLQDI